MPAFLSRLLWPALCIALLVVAGLNYGWPGVGLVAGGIVFWMLLHFTRLMTILKRAANRPIGHVGSAVMLNARLKPGVTLMHVIAMTRSLGQQQSPPDTQPELFRWIDPGGSWVDCEFRGGKLQRWTLVRPDLSDELAPAIAARPSATDTPVPLTPGTAGGAD